jgi:NAD-dependent deacetylase
VVLTGAGISAPSGLPTYRGLGSVPAEARPSGLVDLYERPRALWEYFSGLRRAVLDARPNIAHEALAALALDAEVTVVTLNLDDLHERAGSPLVHHLHGRVFDSRCTNDTCRTAPFEDRTCPASAPVCGACGSYLRPGVVLFGESPARPVKKAVDAAVAEADLLLVVGTTLAVSSALNVVLWARGCRVPRVWLTRDPDPKVAGQVDEVIDDDVTSGLPRLLDRLTLVG